MERRDFIKSSLTVTAAGLVTNQIHAQTPIKRTGSHFFKLALNFYSFNQPLRNGEISVEQVLNFCAEHNFEAADITGYYLQNYPEIPDDAYLNRIKKHAYLLGLDISGTGVRNDFADPDPAKRKTSLQLVQKWIPVAAKLGAPAIRVFAGQETPDGYNRETVEKWVIENLQACVETGKEYGVIIALQNHANFIKTAEQVKSIIKQVDSEWFGIMHDIGSYRTEDPYKDIAEITPHAVNWQIKEEIEINRKKVPTDLKKVFTIIKNAGYRGYLPIETLGAGDPKIKVANFIKQIRKTLEEI